MEMETPAAKVDPRFGGVARLYGEPALARFAAARVLVVGVGGVGCWVAEALARSGVGRFTLVDLDELCVTNMNRQLHALEADIGRPKISVMAQRIRAISPQAEVEEIADFYTEANGAQLLAAEFDLVLDCIDRLRPKAHLIATARQRGLPLVVSGAAGGRVDPGQIVSGDLARVGGDALLSQVRKRLRDEFGFPRGDSRKVGRSRRFGVLAVSSLERPRFAREDGSVSCERPATATGATQRLNCASGFGTSCPVVASFGLRMAALGLGILGGGNGCGFEFVDR